RNVTTMPSALLSRLSLNAPRNWVTNSGAKRRLVRSCTSGERITPTPRSDRRHCRPGGGDETVAHRSYGGRQSSVRSEGHRLKHDAEDERRREIGVLLGNLRRGDPARDHVADGVDGCRRSRGEPRELAVLHEEEKPEEPWVLIVRVAKPADHGGELAACRDLEASERLEPAGKLQVLALEDLPHEFVFADEMAIERTFRDIDGTSNIPHARLCDALLDEEPNGGLLDSFSRVWKPVSRHSK